MARITVAVFQTLGSVHSFSAGLQQLGERLRARDVVVCSSEKGEVESDWPRFSQFGLLNVGHCDWDIGGLSTMFGSSDDRSGVLCKSVGYSEIMAESKSFSLRTAPRRETIPPLGIREISLPASG